MTSLRACWRRLPLWALVLTVVAAAVPAIAAQRVQGTAAGCAVTYTTNEWTGGFTAQIRVTNLGAALNGWRLQWSYGGDQEVTSAWNAQVTQSGNAVIAVNVAYNAVLAAGASTDFGLQGTWHTADPAPTALTLNGTPCGGTATATPTATPTAPPSASPTATPTTTASPTATATGPAPAGCAGATICSDFEDQTGTVPSGAWQTTAPDCQGAGKVSVDTSVAYSGTRSLRVDGGAGYCNHVFAASTHDLSSVGPMVYVRMRVRHTTPLPTNHVTFVSMPDASQGGKALRVGGQNGALQWNRESDDATLPAQSPAGVALSTPLPTGRWLCLRFQIDTTAQSMRTWVDDQEVAGLHVDGVPTPDVDGQWLARTTPPRPTSLRLGWESYGTGDDTLWFDDVALGSSPIGC
ncbi:cellulose-binding domain-containing protein [Streptomyces sp. Li-HN-5-11]|uniref:cellulose-binding domain-containing protein n=1 Tax=Streptomyces sp. Li-HN-5-11 TaxID=3075432 RepID=UPI0028ACF0E7|nr:cellulose-binding domain-containing protein [Streptomyces sp. Li-HN-5-11]WNM29933.1 cellulose-binding domain-containing protein [Streptomyces sp. Li-HN-5-11]